MQLPCFCRLGTVETPPLPRPSMALSSRSPSEVARSPSEVGANDVELNMGPNPFRLAAADRVHPGPNPFQDTALQALGSSDGAAAPKAGAPQAMRRQHNLSFGAARGSPEADGLLPELKVPQLGLQAPAAGPWQSAKKQSLSFKLAGGSPEAASRPDAVPDPAQSGLLLPSSLPRQTLMKRGISFRSGTGDPGADGRQAGAAGRPAAEQGIAEQGPQLPTAGLRWRQSLTKLGAGSPEVNRPPPEVAGAAELGPLLSAGGPRRSAMKGARWKAAAELAGGASRQPAAASAVPALRLHRFCRNRCLDAASRLAQCSMSAQGLIELRLPRLLPCNMSQPNNAQPTSIHLHNQVILALLCRPSGGACGSQQRQTQVESCCGSCSGGPQIFRCDVVPLVL